MADRNKWLGPFSGRSTLAYLNGEYPDDYGWDDADLGDDPTTLERYREAELIHARWAMSKNMGCLTPQIPVQNPDPPMSSPAPPPPGYTVPPHPGGNRHQVTVPPLGGGGPYTTPDQPILV